MDSVKMEMGSIGMMEDAAQQFVKDKEFLVNPGILKNPFCLFPCFFSDHSPALWWLITWRWVKCCCSKL